MVAALHRWKLSSLALVPLTFFVIINNRRKAECKMQVQVCDATMLHKHVLAGP